MTNHYDIEQAKDQRALSLIVEALAFLTCYDSPIFGDDYEGPMECVAKQDSALRMAMDLVMDLWSKTPGNPRTERGKEDLLLYLTALPVSKASKWSTVQEVLGFVSEEDLSEDDRKVLVGLKIVADIGCKSPGWGQLAVLRRDLCETLTKASAALAEVL